VSEKTGSGAGSVGGHVEPGGGIVKETSSASAIHDNKITKRVQCDD
jgi:hypothetical protein